VKHVFYVLIAYLEFIAVGALLTDCRAPETRVEPAISAPSKTLGCETYSERARKAPTLRVRGELLKLYGKCRTRVIALAGKYETSDVRETRTSKKRDASDSDYLLIERTLCLFHGKEKLPKCFMLHERRWAPSAWSMFLKDAARVAAGMAAGFIGGKYGAALLWWLL